MPLKRHKDERRDMLTACYEFSLHTFWHRHTHAQTHPHPHQTLTQARMVGGSMRRMRNVTLTVAQTANTKVAQHQYH